MQQPLVQMSASDSLTRRPSFLTLNGAWDKRQRMLMSDMHAHTSEAATRYHVQLHSRTE